MRTDIAAPSGWIGDYRHNGFSVFSSATKLDEKFENNRWVVGAEWEEGKFDKANTDLYLEIHYRKAG